MFYYMNNTFKKYRFLDISGCDFNFLIEIFSLFLCHCGFSYGKYLFKYVEFVMELHVVTWSLFSSDLSNKEGRHFLVYKNIEALICQNFRII